jgi:hypothetical protein
MVEGRAYAGSTQGTATFIHAAWDDAMMAG